MQKRTNRILSMLLALVMIMTMLPATVLADGETDVFAGWSLTLGENIGVNFYLAEEAANYTVNTTVADNAANYTAATKDGYYVVTVNVAAAQMTDTIGLTVLNGETEVHSGSYTVRQYAETILTGEYDDEVKAMVKEMLNYGAAAQTYFGYAGNGQANTGYEIETSATVPTDVPEITVEDNLGGIGLYGMSLVFRSKTAVRFYFTVSGDISTYTFKVGETAYTPVLKDGKYYVEIGDINPQDLDKDITVSVNDGAMTITYSPLNYIVRKYNNAESSENLKALVQAMYGYHLEAIEYQKYLAIVQIESLTANAGYGTNGLGYNDAGALNMIYAYAAANDAAYNSDWSVEYKPLSADAIKLVRGGVTTSVGITDSGTIVKFGESAYGLKLEAWTISGSVLPLVAQDYLIVEGRFYHEASDTTVQIAKTYIYFDGSNVEFSATEPILPSTVDAGAMQTHESGMSGNGMYFRTAANDAPYNTDWSLEYTQTSVDNIKLIRNGETTSIGIVGRPMFVRINETDYYLKLEAWTIGDYAPITTDDVLIIEGGFYYAASRVTLNITKSYVYYDGSAWVCSEILPASYDVGVLQANVNGHTYGGSGIYFSTQEANDAPYGDWNTYYDTASVDCLKLVRDGETISIGLTDRNTICKFGENDYYLRLENWTIGDYAPFTTDDMFIVEGAFTHVSSKTTLNITKTYIYYDGSAWVFSATEPVPEVIHQIGVLAESGNGTRVDSTSGTVTGVYAVADANDAPYGDWNIEYTPAEASGFKLIRGGVTYDVGVNGSGTIVKFSDKDYFVKLEGHTIKFSDNSAVLPMQDGDILIIEGNWVQATDASVKVNFAKTYILLDGTNAVISATEPVPTTEVDCGVMSEHADGSASEIYFSLAENSVPVDENAETAYAGSVQLVSGGATSSVNANIYKIADDQYYLELDGVELADGDYLIVEGAFANGDNGYVMNITKTYVLVDGETLVYSETEPVLETEYALTGLTNHGNGWTAGGIYIAHDTHGATINSDWSVEYKPVSVDVIKLVRNGVTTSIGQPASGTLVAIDGNSSFLKTEAWTVQNMELPFVDGDQIIIEGKFKHDASGHILNVEKTVIYVDGSTLYYNPIFAGNLNDHSNGINGTDGIYATMAENAAPYDGWNVEFTPVTADDYYVIRNGEQINIGIPGRGTLVKYGATDYYLKMNAWCTENFAFTTDDVFVIEGFWKHSASGTTMKIEKTYLYYDGSAWVFATELPTIVNAGTMQTHESGLFNKGIYVRTAANEAPSNSDWSLEYKQTSVDNIKIIRGGETISIGIVDRPLLIKLNETDYYLKLEAWTIGDYGLDSTSPITTDDVLIIEGSFKYEAENVTLNISKSYVYYDGSAWVCSATEPVPENVYNVGHLSAHTSGGSGTGFYATGAENDAPYDWAAEYAPTSKECIQIIRNGETIYRNNTGAGAIVKFSANGYFVKFDTWIDSENYPLQAGDTIIIEGTFVGTSNYAEAEGVKIKIDKTYVTYDGSSFSFVTDADKYINAGAMSAYAEKNWHSTDYTALYFVLASNIAPADEGWGVRYTPKAASNVKLVRGGATYNIGNTGAETIIKIADGKYALALDNWWWSSYAPIVDGDQLIIEGEFANASNGYTLNIDKTVITFISNADDNVIFSTAASTDFGEVLLPNSADTLTIGMWNGSYHVFNDTDLQRLQAAGITKIMGINTLYIGQDTDGDGTISDAEVSSWLDRVYSYGISVIIDLRDWDGSTVPGYASHPGLIGFLMYDEPCATEFDNLATLKEQFDAVMPAGKLFYVNLFPECAGGTSLVGTVEWALGHRDYDQYYVQKFLDTLDIEVLSWDNYSLLSGSGIRTDYFHNFEVMANKNVPMWYTMLSAGHGTTSASYATPTADELRWQMAVAMTYGVQNIDHYVYVSHEDDYSCMVEYDTWEPTALYYDIKTVDNEYLAWDNIFMAYDWIGVGTYSANSSNSMLTKLENSLTLSDYGIAGTSASENLLIGVFAYNGTNAYMVTNAGSAGTTTVGDGVNFSMNDTTVTLTLDDADYKCVAVVDNGVVTYVAVENNTVTLNVEAYEGVFVIPVLN